MLLQALKHTEMLLASTRLRGRGSRFMYFYALGTKLGTDTMPETELLSAVCVFMYAPNLAYKNRDVGQSSASHS